MVKSRSGFTLVELIVAFALLGIGVVSIAGAAAAGRGALREANAETRALLAAASVLDSLTRLQSPVAGATTVGPDSLAWQVVPISTGARVDVVAHFVDGSRVRVLSLTGIAGTPPPVLLHDR